MTAAQELGYVPVGDYAATVAAEIDWLVRRRRCRASPAARRPVLRRILDYAAEDAYLAAHG